MKLKRGIAFFLAMTILTANIGTATVAAQETDIAAHLETELETEECKMKEIVPETEEVAEIQTEKEEAEEITDVQEETVEISTEPEETETIQEESEEIISIPEQPQETETEEIENDIDTLPDMQEEQEEHVLQSFCQTAVADGVKILVSAPEGVFPEGCTLNVKRISGKEEDVVTNLVSGSIENVAKSYTFDIKVLDSDGNEIQPDISYGLAEITFSPAEAGDPNVEPVIFHITENEKVQELVVTEDEGELCVRTEGFSIYQLDFTYGALQYRLKSDETTKLSRILSAVGLTGNVESVAFGNEKLLSIIETEDGFEVKALQNFDTEEKLTVVINGLEYVIQVTATTPKGICVVLYEDGTLVFQNSGDDFTSEHGAVEKRYVYDEMNPIWNNNDAVIRVEIRTKIQPVHMNKWFQNCSRLKEFSFDGTGIDHVDDMSKMFENCTSLTSVVLKNIKIEHNMTFASEMFSGCSALTTVDLSGWRIGRFEYDRLVFPGTFNGCENLRYLYLKKWNLPYVITIDEVLGGGRSFSGLKNVSLTLLDVSEWSLPQCRSMKDAFSYLAVERINMTGLQIPCVTDFSGLFEYDRKLKQIDGLEEMKVTSAGVDISFFILTCDSLESITFEHVNVKKATSFASNCMSLKYAKLSGWHIRDVSDIANIFGFSTSLITVDLSEWTFDGESLENFGTQTGLSTYVKRVVLVNMRDWTLTAKQISLKRAFQAMNMKYLFLSGWNTEHVITTEEMCSYCKEMEVADFSGWNTASVRSFNAMFGQCPRIKELDLHSFDMSAAGEMKYMFVGCSSLQEINLSTWKVNPDIAFDIAFSSCSSLKRMDISGNNLTDVQYRSANAGNLSSLEEITVDKVSGTPLFLADIQATWYDKNDREYVIGDSVITQKTTLYRHKTENGQLQPQPERPEKEMHQVGISVKTLLDRKEIFKDAPYTLSIYDEDHNWICTGTSDKTFTGLFEEAKQYHIEIQQQNQPNYFVEISGDAFVFQKDMQKQEVVITYRSRADVTVSKTWNDNENEGKNRPEKLEVTLYKNGNPIDTQYLSEENEWTYTWSDLYRYDESDDGNIENRWEVKETVPPGYTEEYVHVQTEKDRAEDFVSLEIVKSWSDYNNVMNQRSSVTFRLFRGLTPDKKDAVEIDNRTYEWFDKNIYTTGWYNLPAYDEDGNRYYYYITEDAMPLYRSDVFVSGNRFRFWNEYTDLETITVIKRWSENPDGITRLNARIDGYAGEKSIGTVADVLLMGKETDLNADNGWKATVTVPKYSVSGEKITSYRLIENTESFVSTKKIEGRYQPYYMKAGNEYIIYNQYQPSRQEPEDSSQEEKPETGDNSFTIIKKWEDDNDIDGLRPDIIEVELYLDGILHGVYPLCKEENWRYKVEDIPASKDKKPKIEVKEKKVPDGYHVEYKIGKESATITNIHKKGYFSICKQWNDGDDFDGIRPASVEVEFYQNDQLYDTYILSEENGWKQEIGELPISDDTGEYSYRFREKDVPNGYRSAITSDIREEMQAMQYRYTVTNTHIPAPAPDTEIRKIWNDQNNEYGYRPDSIEVELYANNILMETYVLSEENEWKQALGVLPQTDADGNKIVYTVKEKEVPVHYLASYEYSSSKHDLFYTTQLLDIINTEASKVADIDWGITNTPKQVDITVKKSWDVSGEYDLSDKKVFVQLFRQTAAADSEETEYGDIQPVDNPVELNAGNEWTYTWKSRIEYMNGHPVKYSVNEVDEAGTVITPEGFIKTISADTEEGRDYTITNTSTKVEVEKTDLHGILIGGAHLQVLSGDDIVAEWDTVKGEKVLLEGILLPDTTYTLHESTAPSGYAVADDVTFTVRSDGVMQTIVMKDEGLTRLPLTGGNGRRTPWQLPFFCMAVLVFVLRVKKKTVK